MEENFGHDGLVSGADAQPEASEELRPSVNDVAPFVKQLCLTYSKFALYPPTHPVTQTQIKTTWNELVKIFGKYGDFDISFSESKLLFFGMPVEEKNITVTKFVQHFEGMQISSLDFFHALTIEEFARFIMVFSQEPKTINEAGGIDLLVTENEIANVKLGSAVYQVVRKDQNIVDEKQAEEEEKAKKINKVKEVGNKTPDTEKAKNLLVKYLESDGSLETIKELLESLNLDTETIQRVIQDLKRIMEETGLDAEELIRYLELQIQQEKEAFEGDEEEPKPKKKRRKRVSKKFRPLADRIRDKLKTDFKEIKGKDKLIEYLDHVYSREINRVVEAKTMELQEQIERDKETFLRIGDALDKTDIGVIVLDDYGKICFLEHAESLPIPMALGDELPPDLMGLIRTSREEYHWKVEQTRVGQIRFILFKAS